MNRDLLTEALRLPEADRIQLADALYESCESDPRDWLDDGQLRTIERRSAEVACGTADLIEAEDVFKQAREMLGQ